MTGPNVPVSGPEDGARERVARVLAAHEPRYRSQHGEPDWFECGPDNDGPTTCTWRSDPEADSEVIAEAFRLHVADALLSVVADTPAGEAEDAVRLIAVRYRDPDIARFAINDYRDWVAARSGGAQDDGLRERVTALAAEYEAATPMGLGALGGVARDLRRALAGPDDARQDGAR